MCGSCERNVCSGWGMPSAVTEDSKQAEEVEHGEEDSGDVSMEEVVKDLCHSGCLQCLRP